MSTRFHYTNNAQWWPKSKPVGKPGSERVVLYTMIEQEPGITSQALRDAWPFQSSLASRLKELADKRCIEVSKECDLFAEGDQHEQGDSG